MHTCRRIEQDNLFRSCPVNLMCVCVCECMYEYPCARQCFAAGFFCANCGIGNHLTSVTSCYVSPSWGAEEQKGRGNHEAVQVLPNLRGMLQKSISRF